MIISSAIFAKAINNQTEANGRGVNEQPSDDFDPDSLRLIKILNLDKAYLG